MVYTHLSGDFGKYIFWDIDVLMGFPHDWDLRKNNKDIHQIQKVMCFVFAAKYE